MARVPTQPDVPADAADIIARLTAIRRRLRTMLAVDGASRVIVRCVAAFLAMTALDCWLIFPAFLRAAGAITLALYTVVSLDRHVLRALLRPIPLREIAARLDRSAANDDDRLSNLVDHVDHRADGASPLWQRVESEARQSLGQLSPDVAVRTRPAIHRAAAAAGILLVLLVIRIGSPGWLETAWYRTVWPFGSAAWPSRVGIDSLARSLKVARGEPYTAGMRLSRGQSDSLRAFLVTMEHGRETQRLMMRLDPDGIYRRTLDSVSADQICWFEAGDATTANMPFRLHVVDRPVVHAVTALVTPPEYIATTQPHEDSLDNQRLAVLQGSHVTLSVAVSKSVAQGANKSAVRFDDAERLPLVPADASGTRLRCDFVAEDSRRFEIVVIDRDGLESRPDRSYEIDARPDDPPTVQVLQPAAAVDATPTATVVIRAAAEDDSHLKSFALNFAIADRPPPPRVDLLPIAAPDPANANRVLASYELILASLGVRPGDLIEYRAEANDEFERAGAPRSVTQTPIMRIRIVGPAEMADRVRGEFLALQSQLRSILSAQETIHDQTSGELAAIVADVVGNDDASPEPPPATRDDPAGEGRNDLAAIQSLAGQQRAIVGRARQLADLSDELIARAKLNALSLDDLAARSTALAAGLRSTSAGPMTTAAGHLVQAAQTDVAVARRDAVSRGTADQASAIAALRELLSLAGDISDVAGAIRRTRELLDRQESLTRRASELARLTAGAGVQSLSRARRSAIVQLAHEQSRLADDARQLVQRMAELADRGSDRAAAAAFQRAFGAAEAVGIADKMAESSRRLAENRTSQSSELQRQAESGLRNVLATLEGVPLRQLEALSKQLADVARRLERLIASQQRLIADNRAADTEHRKADDPADSSAERTRKTAQRQSSVASTTRGLVRQLETSGKFAPTPQTAEVAPPLLSAAGRMDAAAKSLGDGEELDALAAQNQAFTDLKLARERLLESQEKTDDELARRSLEAIRESLVKIRDLQLALQKKAQEQPAAAGKSRAARLRTAGLAKDQSALADKVAAARKSMTGAIVFTYVCDSIITRMKSTAETLKRAELAPAIDQQSRIVTDLNRLIELLAQPPERKDTARFAEAAGSGGDPGSPTRDRPVPPLAELKMLRLLQADINEATASVAAQPEPPDAKSADNLGNQQAALLEMAEKMMKRAENEK